LNGESGFISVLERDAVFRRAIRRELSKVAAVMPMVSAHQADAALRRANPCVGIVLEEVLDCGSGLDWLASAREGGTSAPALIVASRSEPELVNRAYRLRAQYLCKPFEAADLRAFAADIATKDLGRKELRDVIAFELTHMAVRYALTFSEVAILRATLEGMARKEIVDARHVSENTHKCQVRTLLRKLRARSLGEVRDRILRGVRNTA